MGIATTKSNDDNQARPLRVNVLVGGGYAWTATVAGPAVMLTDLWLPRLVALAALAALVGGVILSARFPSWGRRATLVVFLGLCALTWFLLGDALALERLDPVPAAFGGLGWMLFAFAWGAVRENSSVPEESPDALSGAPLKPRARASRLSSFAWAVALVGGMVPWALAWRVNRPEHAVLTHSLALLCSLAVIAVGARVAVSVGGARIPGGPRARLGSASSAGAGLVALTVLGLVLWVLRH